MQRPARFARAFAGELTPKIIKAKFADPNMAKKTLKQAQIELTKKLLEVVNSQEEYLQLLSEIDMSCGSFANFIIHERRCA